MTGKKALALYLILLGPLSFAMLGQTPDIDSARAFVRQVYADYANPDWRSHDKRQKKFYTEDLSRLIEADRTGHDGVCNLDWDPICDCQDPGDPGQLRVKSIDIVASNKDHLKAVVRFGIAGAGETVTLWLVRTPKGWRIDDVSSKETPSLRELLKKPC